MTSADHSIQEQSLPLLTDVSKKALIGYHNLQTELSHLAKPPEDVNIQLLDLLENVRGKWKYAEDRLRVAEERCSRFERNNVKLTKEVGVLKDNERFQASQISKLERDNGYLKEKLCNNEERFELIMKTLHENLENTAPYDKILYGQMDSTQAKLNDVEKFAPPIRRTKSVDQNQYLSRISSSKRTYGSGFNIFEEKADHTNVETHSKEPKSKRSKNDDANVISDDEKPKKRSSQGNALRSIKKRSVSSSRVLEINSIHRPKLVPRPVRPANNLTNTSFRQNTPNGSWTRGKAIAECVHKFVSYRAILGSCSVCARSMSFASKGLQCSCCKICIHEQCKSRAPMPCIPPAETPTSRRQNDARLGLRNFCPTKPPYIPVLLIRCICALEKDGLKNEGIYQVLGNKDDVMRVHKSFDSKFFSDLSQESAHVITSCIKTFFRSLKEPLIPRSSYSELLKAADDDKKLADVINDLPDPNRDTLAYFCLHLQKVVLLASHNMMTVENLANCLYSTIFGDIAEVPNEFTSPFGNPFDAVNRQRAVLERFLKMPHEFWSDYLDLRTEINETSTETPRRKVQFNIHSEILDSTVD